MSGFLFAPFSNRLYKGTARHSSLDVLLALGLGPSAYGCVIFLPDHFREHKVCTCLVHQLRM